MNKAGVYKLFDIDKRLIYIGMSTSNVYERARQSILDKNADYIQTFETNNDVDAMIIEVALIAKYKPRLNKCKAKLSNDQTTIFIDEPKFSKIESVHDFIGRHDMPSITNQKIFTAISHRIVQKNYYNRIPGAIIFTHNDKITVMMSQSRINNVFIDMLEYSNAGIEIDDALFDSKINKGIKIALNDGATLYRQQELENIMGYNEFIPFNEAFMFNIIIVNNIDNFYNAITLFTNEGIRIWN